MFHRSSLPIALRKACLIDRDGVVVQLVDRGEGFMLGGKPHRYSAPVTMSELRFHPDALAAIACMRAKGYLCILVTNQPDVATGRMRPEDHLAIMGAVQATLAFDGLYVCPHPPKSSCVCRKPKPGMLFLAMARYRIDPTASYMIGDMETDVQAGLAAGVHTIRVAPENTETRAHHRVDTILEAAYLLP